MGLGVKDRCYLVCATPRSGSTLLCHLLDQTGVAGHPAEYFEALQHSGLPRQPVEYFDRERHANIVERLAFREMPDERSRPTPNPLWSPETYDRYLAWAIEQGTTPNGVFGAKLMWGYFEDFVSLLRNVPSYRDVPLEDLMTTVFPEVTFIRVVRANKIRQAVSLWKAVQTATWREQDAIQSASVGLDDSEPPYKSFIQDHRPQLRFHYNAIAHLLDGILQEEASWDAFFEHCGISPILVLYENFAADYETSTVRVLERLRLSLPEAFAFEPRMKRQSDDVNDDWARRYSELRLGTELDLVPTVAKQKATSDS